MAVFALLTGCGGSSGPTAAAGSHSGLTRSGSPAPSDRSPGASSSGSGADSSPAAPGQGAGAGATKVMVIAEENETYGHVLGNGSAPYLDSLAHRYANATAMDAGYPTNCPSLAAYLIMTSGDRHGVCDDDPPSEHPIGGDNIFSQLAASGREWRNYAESMPAPCSRDNDGNFLVRHAPAAYYVSEQGRCEHGMVPLGSLTSGALHDDVASGNLPSYAFVTPDACDDMHGGHGCDGDKVPAGDAWLKQWLTAVMAGPDYRSGHLVVFIVWDEGSDDDNHVPALVVSPQIHRVTVSRKISQCDLLRTEQELLRLSPLGCAGTASSLVADLGL